MDYYTGIGARKTPGKFFGEMTQIAEYLYKQDYILRSGGADGADLAFEKGAKDKKEIYLPWKGFNNSNSDLYEIPDEAFKIAEKIHPAWERCKDEWKKFHARNVLQVLGKDLNTPSDFVVCWTKGGIIVGGTGIAMRIAKLYDIPLFNLAVNEDYDKIMKKIRGG